MPTTNGAGCLNLIRAAHGDPKKSLGKATSSTSLNSGQTKTKSNEKEDLSEGTQVWVPADSGAGWVPGEVLGNGSSSPVKILLEDGKEKEIDRSVLHIRNPQILDGIDDMTQLSYMHHPAILHNLLLRYNRNVIYTYTGHILIAINPYCSLPHLYSEEMLKAYCGQPIGKLQPHAYAIAENAYRSMLSESKSQSILVSGESGAGKTESTKFMLNYLAAMSSQKSQNSSIQKKILETVPLLEAFGNSKTQYNDNSSRFGKFIIIQFDNFGNIVGSSIRTYLLEKSRIVKTRGIERTYHIFYQLLKGASAELRSELKLSSPENYFYLHQSSCFEVENVDDSFAFQRTKSAMSALGITQDEQKLIFEVLAAILHIGNIKFTADTSGEEAVLVDETPVNIACGLLQINSAQLQNTLLKKNIQAVNELLVVPLNREQAEGSRDALAMLLYSKLFDWLVERVNANMGQDPNSKLFIGILDIYGFESFDTNSFEQFCINYANEKLQQQFNYSVFKLEQQEYIKEQIDWSYIDFNDNQRCLDLLEAQPMCIISLLDDASKFVKATDEGFALKLYSTHLDKASHFKKPKRPVNGFTVVHYAGDVAYDTSGFLEKNRDYIIPEQLSLLEHAAKLQTSLFQKAKPVLTRSSTAGSGGSRLSMREAMKGASSFQMVSAATQFKTSLADLMQSINSTNTHYVRCLKPNMAKEALRFDQSLVLHQLACGGVLEAVRISSAGYPTRRDYAHFYSRYKLLTKHKASQSPKECVQNLFASLPHIPRDAYQFGKTVLFLRAGKLAHMEKLRLDRLNAAATSIQKHWKRILTRRWYLRIRSCIIIVQASCRKVLARSKLIAGKRLKSAIMLQSIWRMYRQRKKYRSLLRGIHLIQRACRTKLRRLLFKGERVRAAAVRIQNAYRAHVARRKFTAMCRAVVIAQSCWRAKLTRRKYLKLRVEDRARLLAAAKQKVALESKMEELQWRLTAETRSRARADENVKKMESAAEESSRKFAAAEHRWQIETQKQQNENLALRRELDEMRKAMAELREQHTKSKGIQTGLVSSLESANSTLRTELEQIRTELDEREQKVLSLEKGEISLKSELAAVRQQLSDSERSRRESEDRHAKELAAVRRQLEDKEASLCALNDLVNSVGGEAKVLKQKLEEREKYRAQERSQLEEINKRLEILSHEKEQRLLKEKQDLHREFENLSSKKSELESQVSNFQSQLRGLQEKVDTDNQRLQQSTADLEKISQNLKLKMDYQTQLEKVSAELQQKLESETKLRSKLEKIHQKVQLARVELSPQELDLEAVVALQAGSMDKGRKLLVGYLVGESEQDFVNGLPLPAFVMFRFLRYWRELYAAESSLLPYISASLRALAHSYWQDVGMLSFAFSNVALLLHLVTKELEADDEQVEALAENPLALVPLHSSRQTGEEDGRGFHKDLAFLLGEIFVMLVERAKNILKPVLTAAFFETVQSQIPPPKSTSGSNISDPQQPNQAKGSRIASPRNNSANKNVLPPFELVQSTLADLLSALQQNFVYISMSQQFFKQIFRFLNAHAMNSLLLRKDLCTAQAAKNAQIRVKMLEKWAVQESKDWLGEAVAELEPLKQACGFVCLSSKNVIAAEQVRNQLCAKLSCRQLKQLAISYIVDDYELPVEAKVIDSIPDEGQLLFDTQTFGTLLIRELHFLSLDDLQRISLPIAMKREMEKKMKKA